MVIVLMATHQGRRHLDEQLDSILGQRDVDVQIVVSDDASTDGTQALLHALAARDERVRVLEPGTFGSAQANFLRLIREVDADGADGVALADQDDVWHPDKLARQLAQLATTGAGAASGDVDAVFGTRRVRIRKSQPQRALDFVCESGGPGCTYVLTPSVYARVRRICRDDVRVDAAAAHDWLVYALVRASGVAWHIDRGVLVDYRQHETNVIGANIGVRAAIRRSRRLRSGSFRLQCATIAEITADLAAIDERRALESLARDLRTWDLRSRWRTLRSVPRLRRRARDRIALWLATATRTW